MVSVKRTPTEVVCFMQSSRHPRDIAFRNRRYGARRILPERVGDDGAVEHVETRVAEHFAAVIDHPGIATLAHVAAAEGMRGNQVSEQAPCRRDNACRTRRFGIAAVARGRRADERRRRIWGPRPVYAAAA